MSVRPGWIVECCASAISTVASPNFMVSPPLATTICFSGTPSVLATSAVSGARWPGDRAEVGDVVEMRVRDEDRFRLGHVGGREAELVRPRRAIEIRVE